MPLTVGVQQLIRYDNVLRYGQPPLPSRDNQLIWRISTGRLTYFGVALPSLLGKRVWHSLPPPSAAMATTVARFSDVYDLREELGK